MTTMTPEAAPEAEREASSLHIHLPADLIVESLGQLAAEERPTVRRDLAEQARLVHGAALAHTLETGRAEDIPSAAIWPNIVGHETVATMALSRRQTGRGLMQHPTDPTRHLIVPL